jgi:hypothetical protein
MRLRGNHHNGRAKGGLSHDGENDTDSLGVHGGHSEHHDCGQGGAKPPQAFAGL